MRYRPALDGIRALAVLAVFTAHAGIPHFVGGGVGVQVFFALSGYLITTLLLAENARFGQVGFLRFYGRRALRLLPAVILLLVGVSAVTLIIHGPSANYEAIPLIFFYVANWARSLFPHYNPGWYGHMWSLSVEEQFYLVWPAVLFLALRASRRKAIIACVAGMAAALAIRIVEYHSIGDLNWIFYGSDTVSDDLLAGCLGALLFWKASDSQVANLKRGLRWLFWPALAWIIWEIFALPSVTHPSRELTLWITGGRTIEALASAVLVVAVATETAPRACLAILSWAPLVMLGQVSYGFYLWHVSILDFFDRYMGYWPHAVTALIVSVIVSSLSYILLERPLQRRFRGSVAAGGAHQMSDVPTHPTIGELPSRT